MWIYIIAYPEAWLYQGKPYTQCPLSIMENISHAVTEYASVIANALPVLSPEAFGRADNFSQYTKHQELKVTILI